jgi:Flp pilus assembly protein TadG
MIAGRRTGLFRRGTTSVQLVVIMVPVFFGFMGFAVDLGRLYMIKGELKAAADAAALAAAAQLIGTDTSTTAATAAAQLTLETISGYGNKYNFRGNAIGGTADNLSSEFSESVFYEAAADATGTSGSGSSDVTGSTARHVKVSITAEAPLLFWGFLSTATDRKTPITVSSVAGMSAPLCTACAIQPLAIGALDTDDTTNYGYELDTRYTFYFYCSGGTTPSAITGATTLVPYLMINRYNEESEDLYAEENQQAYRIGAQGLLPSATSTYACVTVQTEDGEDLWENAAVGSCSSSAPTPVTSLLCGLYTRFDSTVPDGCSSDSITDIDTMSTAYQPDTDVADVSAYAEYTGNGRRVITVPIVEELSSSGAMNVLGFRQFLIEPDPDTTTITPSDTNGRFAALYIGSVVPLKQGSFAGCTQTAGPGKVVLHR